MSNEWNSLKKRIFEETSTEICACDSAEKTWQSSTENGATLPDSSLVHTDTWDRTVQRVSTSNENNKNTLFQKSKCPSVTARTWENARTL